MDWSKILAAVQSLINAVQTMASLHPSGAADAVGHATMAQNALNDFSAAMAPAPEDPAPEHPEAMPEAMPEAEPMPEDAPKAE
jgi:hypothetical protein